MSKVSPNKNAARTRLSKLRRMLSLSQREFAQNVQITQGALSQLESGKSSLSMESIRKISEIYNVDCNWLIRGEGSAFLAEPDLSRVSEMHQTVIMRNERDQALIPLINEEARAGYVKNCKDVDYLRTLDVYRIPGFEEGDYRLFEIEGDSMIPTIYPREIVVAENKPEWNEIESGKICIVISAAGIIAKRVYFYDGDRSQIILKSDNAKFKTYSIPASDVVEIWEVRAKITNVFAQENLMHARKIEMLELDINALREEIRKLGGNVGKASAGKRAAMPAQRKPAGKPAPKRKPAVKAKGDSRSAAGKSTASKSPKAKAKKTAVRKTVAKLSAKSKKR